MYRIRKTVPRADVAMDFIRYSNAAIISQNCASFKFDATFRNQKTGRYYIVWKILLQPGFLVSRGFHVQAIISYEDEPAESSGSLDVTIPETRIKELSVNEWHDITVREQLIIRPHRGAVNVQLYLSNNEDPNKGNKENKEHNEYHNFKVGSVEIHPYTNLGPDFISHGPTTGDPFASLNIKRADNIPISRISAATDVDHIAVLRVAKDKVHIDIWDYGGIQDQPKDANSLIDWEPKAEKALDNQSGIHGLSLGISLSPDGRQLVVFQEPRIGDWRDGEIIKYAKFEFKLFHVSIVMAPRSKKSEVFEIDMNSTGSELSRSDAASNIWSLRSFVGFAKFLPTRSAMATTAIGEYSTKSEGTNGAKSLFAACNGIYLDIFDCSKNPWLHLHSIALTDLSPTLSRRITCQMMVESMGSDTFLWLEAQGQACSTWSIENGANISHLSSEDNVNFADRMYQSTLKMAISPDESIVALAGIDGSIRTFFAKSGIEIKSAWPKNFKIEYIGFLGENDQILLIIRDSITNQLQSWILDPMDLRIRIKSNPVPIPTAGTTISVVRHIGASELANKSIVCAAEGTALRFYRIQEPPTVPTATPPKDFANQELADIDATIDYDDIEEGEVGFGEGGKLKYKLRCKIEKEPLENGEGKFYWVLRVSVRQETDALEPEEKILFNFVPEPWLRCLTSEYTMPDQLLTTYFLPCRKRFIIIGLQSIQIWGLPSKNNPNLKLLAIWSMPKNDIISPSKGLKPSSKVFDHFWNIEHALINDNYSDLTRLKVKLFGSNKYEDIVLPGDNSNTDQYGVVPCCLSIHLLAAAYSFATENENSEQHARALVMFSIQNINRVTTLDSILTVMSSIGNVPGIKKPDGQMLVNVLILLLSNSSFRRTSNPFIREMLSTTQWIPREQLSLNPIQQAINSENRDIVHTLVDYCIQNAKRHHPAYLTPAIQSLNDLKEHYRELAARMFSEASYIKVKNKSYVAANATIANPHYKFWKPRSKSLEDYTNPVLYLRSQLPFRSNARRQGGVVWIHKHCRNEAARQSSNGCYFAVQMAGIYDPLNNDLDPASKSGYSFKILLALFILFTVILLMNVLIAIMNDGYSESRDEGQLAWLKQWSLVIVETELSMMGNTTRGNRDLFPDYIYYGASQQEVEEHAKRTSQTQNLEAPNIKGLQPNVATHKAMQRNFTSVREELETLMNNQEQIQSEVTQMNDFVWRLIELLAQQNSDPQYNMLALHLGQEYSQMEPNLNPPGPTTSSFTTVSATSSSIRAKHTTRTHSNNELAPGSSLRPRMRMAEQQKRHRGSLHSRRTSGSTHGVAANPEPPQASPAQQVQPPPTFPPSESSNTSTTTATICEEVAVEVIKSEIVIKEDGHVKEVVEVKETGKVSEPAVSKGSSWFRRVISTTEAAARGAAGAVGSSAAGATGAVVHGAESATHGVGHVAGAVAIGTGVVAVGAGLATAGALYKVDGVWKRTVQVLATRKAHVDEVCPIAKTSYVYYDEDVYDAVLTEKNTGVTYVIQLVYDTETKVYYVYCRYGETDYKLDGPHETIEAAKDAFQLIYKEKFDVDWTERETSVSERWSYEVKTYETFEEVEEVEEVVEETEVNTIIVREHCICLDEATVTTETTTTTTEEVVNQEEESVIVDATIEEVVQDVAITEESVDESEPVQEITTIATETGAVPGSSSQHSPDEPQYQGRPQKSNIFTYNIKRQSTDEVDYVSGGKHQQHRDDYESDDGGAYKQNKTRRRPAAKAKAKYLDDN
ncbi:hypothetical protein BGX26_005145 [Mortierella sp. AD094]|nr:hypothetical protein BGX26_005145 [Mortierella sp. AD094]